MKAKLGTRTPHGVRPRLQLETRRTPQASVPHATHHESTGKMLWTWLARFGQSMQKTSRSEAPGSSASYALLQTLQAAAAAGWRWLLVRRRAQIAGRRLRVVETVALGEKRFVALLNVDGAQFLIGGGATGISLLATLEANADNAFARALHSSQAPEVSQ